MRALALASVLLSAALPAAAQLESPLLSRIQPNIVNPGGKSQAMGGAFVAIADDATAAFSNPAGLPQLSALQFGASGKAWSFGPELSTSNWYQVSPTGYALDSVDLYRITGSAADLEYVSLVVPVTQRLSLALYRAVNLRYHLDASDLPGGSYRAFFVNKLFASGTQGVSLDEEGGVDLRNEAYGLSAGYRLGALSAGAGITLNRLRYELLGSGPSPHRFRANAVNLLVPSPTDVPMDVTVGATIEGGTKAGLVAGLRLEVDEAYRVSAGAVWRRNPRWDVDYAIRATFPTVAAPPVSFSCGVDDPKVPGSGASACGTFKVPDDVALGVAGMPVPSLVVSLELQRVFYSQMSDGFVPVFAYRSGTARAIPWGRVEDGWVPRAGLEWTLPVAALDLALRAGWYREPAHGLKVELYPDADADRRPDCWCPTYLPPYSEAFSTVYDGGRADDHVSFGVGATIGRTVSIDLAVDVGRASRLVALSAFTRF